MSTAVSPNNQNRTGGGVVGFFMNNSVSAWIVTLVLLFVGINSFFKLGQLEDPDFTIKNAIQSCP